MRKIKEYISDVQQKIIELHKLVGVWWDTYSTRRDWVHENETRFLDICFLKILNDEIYRD